jgi:hypothetical protein
MSKAARVREHPDAVTRCCCTNMGHFIAFCSVFSSCSPWAAAPLAPNARLQLLPEAAAQRSKAEAVGSQLQGIVQVSR